MTDRAFVPDPVRGCSRKVRYPIKRIAHRVAKKVRQRSGEDVWEYRCQFCDGYHIGHVPSSKRREAS